MKVISNRLVDGSVEEPSLTETINIPTDHVFQRNSTEPKKKERRRWSIKVKILENVQGSTQNCQVRLSLWNTRGQIRQLYSNKYIKGEVKW